MSSHDTQHPQYVLTHDLGQRVQMFRQVGLEVPTLDDPLIVGAQQQLVADVREALPEGSVLSIPMVELAQEVVELARERWPNAYLVSACPEIPIPEEGMYLEVSRLYALRAEFMGVGSRPGFPTLVEQLRSGIPEDRQQDVVIVEDGIYSGATVERIVEAMKINGITPKGMVAGFAFPQARPIIDSIEHGGTPVLLARDLSNPVAWHPDHDFFPLVPGCGRVVGFTMNGRYRTNRFPLYTHNQAAYAFPYLPQISDSEQLWVNWTGLPVEVAPAIGEHCLANVRQLFARIEVLTGRTVTLGDLIGTPMRTNLPLKVGQSDFPPLERRAIDYLHELS